MKTLINLILASLLLAFMACSPSKKEDGYQINLTVEDAPDSIMVTLSHRVDKIDQAVDSLLLIDGNATFTGSIEGQPEQYYLKFDGQRRHISLFLENTHIAVNTHIDSLRQAKVSGSLLNDRLAAFNTSQKEIRKKMEPLYPAYQEAQKNDDKAKMAEIDSTFDVLQADLDKLGLVFIGENKDNILGPYWASRIYYYDDYLAQLDSVFNIFDPSLKESVYMKNIEKTLVRWNNLKIGMVAPDFSQADSLGNQVSLSSLRGKYILIDFWAAWCGPCRSENPNIVKAYQKYHEKGFDILGVSLDESRDKWIEAITKDKLTWNHVSDLKGWNNEVSTEYGIRAIPYSLLLDTEGKIIGKNLRGEKLQEALAEALD